MKYLDLILYRNSNFKEHLGDDGQESEMYNDRFKALNDECRRTKREEEEITQSSFMACQSGDQQSTGCLDV